MKKPNLNKKDRVISPWTILRRNGKLGESTGIDTTKESNISPQNCANPALKQEIQDNFKQTQE